MAGVVDVVITADFAKTEEQLDKLAHRVTDLHQLNENIGQYLVNSIRNRIIRTKTAPDGTPWADRSEVTQEIWPGSLMYVTGELASSVRVADADNHSVTVVADAPYASYLQRGRSKTRGMIRSNKPMPARPFMGISKENTRRIARMLRDHIKGHETEDDWGFGG